MALDIYVGKSRKAREYCFSMEEVDFNTLLSVIQGCSMSLNKLNKFNDYYSDVIIKSSELNGLKVELNLLFDINKNLNLTIKSLLKTIDTAMVSRFDIFALAN